MNAHTGKESGRRPRIATAALGALIVLLVVELLLRVVAPVPKGPDWVEPTRSQYRFFRFDPVLGWANAPNAKGTYKRSEFEYTIEMNALGMRERPVERAPRPGQLRIAFLGDSFTWGIGVADEDRFSDIVGRTPGVESVNFGVSGYAPVQYFLTIDHVIGFSPDLVIIAICLDNDFVDNVHYERYNYYTPYAVLGDGGEIEVRGYPIRNTKAFGFPPEPPRLALSRVIDALYRDLFAGREQAGLLGFSREDIYQYDAVGPEENARADTAIEINEKLLGRIAQKLKAAAIPLMIISAPSKCEYDPDCDYGNSIVNTNATDFLAESARRLDVDYVDTVRRMDGTDFWETDGHWRPEGHRKMADAILEYLRSEGYLEE
jgi:hypothetical protein